MKSAFTLIKGDKHNSNTDYRDALPVNMIAINRPMFGAAGYMIQAPGLTQYATASDIHRGGLWNERQQTLFRVAGTELITVADDGTVAVLGTIPGTDLAVMPYSFNTQAIIANGQYFLYDPVNGFREVLDVDLGSPIDAVWVDNYYFFTDGAFLYHTDITDESSIDPLKFATSEYSPDPTVGLGLTADNKVVAFNRYSIEYFVNQATDNFAFQRIATRAIKAGLVGTHCKCELENHFVIMGGAKEEAVSVHIVSTGQLSKIATREIDQVIAQYSEAQLSQAKLETVMFEGYHHVLVHLPNETLVYNHTIAKAVGLPFAWSIWKSDVEGDTPYRAIHFAFDPRLALWTVGDKQDGRIGYLDVTVGTQYDAIVEWLLFTPFLFIENQSINSLEIETIPGFTGSDDATVFISLTYDGITYGKENTRLYGRPNDYNQRFTAYRLGYVRDWFGLKLRGASLSRMAFARGLIDHG